MSIKQSSDELNPTIVTAAPVAGPILKRSFKDYVALAIATCGVGYIPIAPGTFGSLVGVGLWVLVRGGLMTVLWSLAPRNNLNILHIAYGLITFQLIAIGIVTLIGTWAASRTEAISATKDPGKVVIDEVAGQMIALTAVPMDVEAWWSIFVAFILFRFFDIVKPYPARKLESLKGGLGIMADDLIAGVYAGVVVALVVTLQWFL